MSQNGSTSAQICACGCGKPIKPRQRWYEPACKARAYRAGQRAVRADDSEIDYQAGFDDGVADASARLTELRRKLDTLEQAYTLLWEAHQQCQVAPSVDRAWQPWFGDAYAVLGVRPDAEWEVIDGAYKALVKKYHPDRHPGDPVADFRMKKLTAAYAEVQHRRGHR